jgi:hypothetical protein
MDYGKGVYCCVYNLLIPSQVLEVWLLVQLQLSKSCQNSKMSLAGITVL